ncbi:MAG TPA: hypothetical protein VHU87_13150 [Rhizomicrobium sp.]|jgi:hypothetical protein|nr:hypothetical protein [Rhizomicrobium sp.]
MKKSGLLALAMVASIAVTASPALAQWRMPNDWVKIGSARFAGHDDRDSGAAGAAGRHVTELGFRPISGDAICQRVNVRFANGVTRPYSLNNDQPLHQDQTYRIDMPGVARNVDRVTMRCHALGKNAVTINIYGNK